MMMGITVSIHPVLLLVLPALGSEEQHEAANSTELRLK